MPFFFAEQASAGLRIVWPGLGKRSQEVIRSEGSQWW
jgi:hypothetical protein